MNSAKSVFGGLASSLLIFGCYQGIPLHEGAAEATSAEPSAGDESGAAETGEPAEVGECDVPTASRALVRRLSETEYDNAVEELLQVSMTDIDLAADSNSGPFATNRGQPASIVSVTAYMEHAEIASERAASSFDTLISCDDPELSFECAESFVASFGRRAYRRALTDQQSASLLSLLHTGEDPRDGVRLVIERVLQSPQFLYHAERSTPGTGPGSLERLTGYSTAEKLASFLWNSIPDEALLLAAENGELDTAEGVQEHALRMLQDPRSVDTFVDFFDQWFDVARIRDAQRDPELFPHFTADVMAAMHEETHAFVRWMIESGNFTYTELLLSSKAFPGEALADYYGVEPEANGVAIDYLGRVGLFTHPSFTAGHAKFDQTAVVGRGAFLLDTLLCVEFPPPPADVEDDIEAVDPSLPQRERLAQHREDPACAGCHDFIDPLGYGLESYGPDGLLRTEDELGHPIDASGFLRGTDQDGEFDGVQGLMERIAASEVASRCAVTQWMRFAQRRLHTDGDVCSIDQAHAAFADSGKDFGALVLQIVASDAFRYTDPTAVPAGVQQ
ncbi:MAG: DUF1592 domain-containing protein [Myxococcota bacterium]